MSKRDDGSPARGIPLPVQREVRQRCGFGCVICGLPLYEYDHMLGWANVKRHIADEITLLCRLHHGEKTSGLLPAAVVEDANANPYNLRTGVSTAHPLHFSGDECEVEVGSNRFTTQYNGYGTESVPLMIDGVPIIGFILGDDHLLLNVLIFDICNELALRIQNNVITYQVSNWDVEFKGKNLVIRDGPREILLDIIFDVPNRVHIRRAKLQYNGIMIKVSESEMQLVNNGSVFRGSTAVQVQAGIVIGTDAPNVGTMIRIEGVSRYVGRQ